MKKRIILVVFIILFVGVGLLVFMGQNERNGAGTYYSGTIEATHAELSFQTGGKITVIYVDEGNTVKRSHVLASLDRSEFDARLTEASAAVVASDKNIARLETLLVLYRQTLPADVLRASATVESAQAVFREAANDRERYDSLLKEAVVSQRDWDTANLRHDTAKAALNEARAALRQAESNLKKIETTKREIDAAKANRDAAAAMRDVAKIRLSYSTMEAPFDGIITSRNMETGEVVTAGQEVLTLSDLSTVDLKIYVGEEEIGKVTPGMKASVRIDTYPDRVYEGRVSYISPEGEFTPKIIQTHKERVKLVYLVKIAINNPTWELKPGMPADAWLKEPS